MKKTISFSICFICIVGLAVSLWGCRSGDVDTESLHKIVYENRTEYPLVLEMWEKFGNGEKLFGIFKIEAGSSVNKEVWALVFGPSIFSHCKITFDDGRILEMHKGDESPLDYSLSPVSQTAYSFERLEDSVVFRFLITDEHYQAAERINTSF